MKEQKYIFVFNGENSTFPLGIFSTPIEATDFITTYKLSGVLTKYPLGIDIYNWTIQKGFFKIKNENQKSPKFIAQFSSAYLEHWHIENGIIDFEIT
jgi:hypothetical protein